MEPKITLSFTPQVLDYLAKVLMQRPYAEVAAVMADIQQQVADQQRPPVGNGHDTSAPGPDLPH